MDGVSAVMPSLNGLGLLKEHLGRIIEELEGSELVIADDGSTDGTLLEAPPLFPSVRFLRRDDRPRGFSNAVNDAVSASSGDIVILLNNDIIPDPGAFGLLARALREAPPGVWAAVPEVHREGYGDEGLMRFGFRRGLAVTFRTGPGTVYPCGACVAFRRTAWQEMKGLDPRFAPLYWEDADLGARAAARGWTMTRAAGARIVHRHASTSGHSMRARRLRERNRFIFMKVHYSDLASLLRTAAWMPAHLVLAALRGRFEFHLGLADYLIWRVRRARGG